MDKSPALWLCRLCYLEKEIRYAVRELKRGGEGYDWHAAGLARLGKLA